MVMAIHPIWRPPPQKPGIIRKLVPPYIEMKPAPMLGFQCVITARFTVLPVKPICEENNLQSVLEFRILWIMMVRRSPEVIYK